VPFYSPLSRFSGEHEFLLDFGRSLYRAYCRARLQAAAAAKYNPRPPLTIFGGQFDFSPRTGDPFF